jgi:hypothetical protein
MTGTWLTTGSAVIVAMVASMLRVSNSAAMCRSQVSTSARCDAVKGSDMGEPSS